MRSPSPSGGESELSKKYFIAKWDKGHRPLMKWGVKATDDKEFLDAKQEAHPGSYRCIALGQSGMVVLDIDVKKGKDGMGALFDLTLKYGDLPETLTVETPSGGRHYFFYGECAHTVERLGSGIDTPVMVPVPGSVIEGKGEYKIICNTDVAFLPDWIKDLAGAPREKDPLRHIPAVDLDQQHNIEAAKVFLNSASPAIQGAGGDDHTYRIACRVRDYGISESMALALMLNKWNNRCQPPWDSEELSLKIANAYNYAASRAGEDLPEAQFQPVPEADRIAPGQIEVYADEHGPRCWNKSFKGIEPPVMDWIIEDWLPMGESTSLYGPGGGGKSLLAFQLATAISTGGSWLGISVARTLPCLVVFCEDSWDEVHRRGANIFNSAQYAFEDKLKDDMLLIESRQGMDAILAREDKNLLKEGKFYKQLDASLKAMGEGPKVLILDTLADIYAGNENDRSMVNYFIKVVIGGLAKRHDATPILLGHPAKASDSEYSGSTAWSNAVRNRLTLAHHPNKNLKGHRVLTRDKSNYAATGEGITIEWIKGVYERVDEASIVDDLAENNMDLIEVEITSKAANGTPYGIAHQSPLSILRAPIKGSDGRDLSKEDKKSLVDRLIHLGRVHLRSGMKHGNGLFPSAAFEEEVTE